MTEPVRTTKRACRYCGAEYRAPAGSSRAGCPTCAPTLLEEPPAPAPSGCACLRMVDGAPDPPVHEPGCPLYDGIPF